MPEPLETKKITLEELKRLGILKKASEIKGKKIDKPSSILKVFPHGEFIETPFKKVFKVENIYPEDTDIGIVKIKDIYNFLDDFNELFSILGKNEYLKKFHFDKLLFFDVESTGLSSGAGNMVFLIGLGFFNKKKEFVIQQYFIEDFINEKGLLYILEDFFKVRSHLISYNGKCFDFYVLKNRFILSRRFAFTLDNLYHFDLLHTSRRMWKNILGEFNLGNMEKKILKLKRSVEDIPGCLIPEYYRNYLKTHNAHILEKIFYHNLMDVLSMLGLLIIQIQNLKLILNKSFPEQINYNSMASLLYEVNKDISLDLLHFSYEKNKDDRLITLRQLYHHYKKQRNYKQMIEFLNKIITESPKFDYFPYVELSKIYEHNLKEHEKALEILKAAESRVECLSKMYKETFSTEIDDIIKRKERLKKKCLKK